MLDLKKRFVGFLNNHSGVAAVEFALIVPIFALLVFGGFATYNAVQVNRAVERSASIIADLTSRLSVIDDDAGANLIAVGKSLSGDVSSDDSYEIKLSSISNTFDAFDTYELEVDWSFSSVPGNKLKKAEIADYYIPFIPEGESVILVTVKVDYATMMFQDMFGLVALEQSSTRRPRFVPLVAYE